MLSDWNCILWFLNFSSLILIGYIYFGFPIILLIKRKFFSIAVDRREIFPMVTLIISAYNEEKVIQKKIENSLALDYPRNRIEIVVASDGSNDSTNFIVRKFKCDGVKLMDSIGRHGKTYVQNKATEEANGEVLVFSDSNAFYEVNALKELMKNFNDKTVGAVSGCLKYYSNIESSDSSKVEGIYWKYENFLKMNESASGSVIGANGSIYAIRKECYVPLKEDLISDFVEPLKVVEKGYRVIYDENAVSRESVSENMKIEFNRKQRILLRSYAGLWHMRKLLNPFKYGFFSIQLISHKLLRWFAFFPVVVLFVTNIFLLQRSFFYYYLFLGQVFFYGAAFLKVFSKNNNKITKFPFYFCSINFAAFLAFCEFLKGKRKIIWETKR